MLWNYPGNVLMARADWAGAAESYHKTLQTLSDFLPVDNNLAILALQRDPNSAEALSWFKRALRVNAQDQEALKFIQRILDLAPAHAEARQLIETLRARPSAVPG